MGNKHSVQAATAAPPLNIPSPLNDPNSKTDKNQTKSDQDVSSGLFTTNLQLRNPGTVEDLNKQCKDVFPTNFEGCRMIFNKGLSNHFQISHTINMSNITPAGYRFGVTYVGTNMVGPGEAYPILLGDIDPSGNLNANIIHQFHPRVRSKLVAQFQDNKCTAAQFTSDYKGDTYTASCTLVNIDILNKSGIAVGHFLKNLTPKFDLGCELATQYGNQIPDGSATALSLVGRYTSQENNSVLSGSLQPANAHLHYYKKIQENFQAGVELETNLAMGESVASLGYQIDLPKADLTFRGSLDSNWQVGAVLEKKLQPFPLTLTLSGAIDHGSKHPSYKFGVGLCIG